MKCKKLIYNSGDEPPFDKKVIFGIIIEEDVSFLVFKTGKKREYRIAKSQILSLQDTNREFEEGM